MPSECLPIVTSVGECDFGPAQQHQAELHVLEDRIVLCLKTRKNRPLGARLVVHHMCASCMVLPWLQHLQAGEVLLVQAVSTHMPCPYVG